MKGTQLPLAVQLRDTASFDSFHVGPNREAVDAMQRLEAPLLIYGAPGSGRTHLLQAACRARQGAYLPLRELAPLGAEVLDGYEAAGALLIDDIDAVGGQHDWCLRLLRLIDAQRSGGKPFALSSSAPPERLELALPDLRTRLSQCVVIGLRALDDADRSELLRLRAHRRGLVLGDDLRRWLLNTRARDTGSLLAALDCLDRATLSEKRRLTLPLAQRVLADADARTAPD